MRRIDFYVYEAKEPNMVHSYKETMEQIIFGSNDVVTTSMACLSTEVFEMHGFDNIYIHESEDDIINISYDPKTKNISCDRTDKELRLAHNLEKMWKACAFARTYGGKKDE